MASASLLQARHLLARRAFASSSRTTTTTRQGGWGWCSEIITTTQRQRQYPSSCAAAATTNYYHYPRCYFSAEPSMAAAATHDDKPLIPGIGRGKTSTGLVSIISVSKFIFSRTHPCTHAALHIMYVFLTHLIDVRIVSLSLPRCRPFQPPQLQPFVVV